MWNGCADFQEGQNMHDQSPRFLHDDTAAAEEQPVKRHISMRMALSWGFAATILMVVVLALYGSALHAGWRFDDGSHLDFVSIYSPYQYFFVPSITALQSGSNVTPWNPLIYAVNLTLFGLRPQYFYGHQLLSLWMVALALYWLGRKHMNDFWAIAGALLFLSGVSTSHIAQELMTGHYLDGLLFAVLCIGCYTPTNVPDRRWLSVVFYTLAVTCKEVYVPLPLLLLFLPDPTHTVQLRVRRISLHLLVTCLYLGWRHTVLGSFVGGYQSTIGLDEKLLNFCMTLPKFGQFLFGPNDLGIAATLVALFLLIIGLMRRWRVTLLIAITILLLPLVPLATEPGIHDADRYFFAPWAAFSYFVAAVGNDMQSRKKAFAIMLAALIILTASIHISRDRANSLSQHEWPMYEASFSYFSCDGDKSNTYFALPANVADPKYWNLILNGYWRASKYVSSAATCKPPVVVDHEVLFNEVGAGFVIYDDLCHCVRPMKSEELMQRRNHSKYRFVNEALTVTYEYNEVTDKYNLRLGPYPDKYKLILSYRGARVTIPIPSHIDNGQLVTEFKGDFIIWHEADDGRIVRSSPIPLRPASGQAQWRQ
jgi:hypothetical protein